MPRLTHERIALIRELHASGSPRKVIAFQLGLTYETVRRYTSEGALEKARAKEARRTSALMADPERYALKKAKVISNQAKRRRKQKLETSNLDYSGLPEHLQEGVRDWIELGRTPGSFLRSVIRNDLKEAVARADDQSYTSLRSIVQWFYHTAPQGSWGSDKCLGNWPLYIKAKRRQEGDVDA